MIYKAKFRFITNKTITGLYEKIELTFLHKAFSFGEAESELKNIINKNHYPKDSPMALTMAIVNYDEILMLETTELNDYKDYKFYEVKLLFKALTIRNTLKITNKSMLIQEYSMDDAKKKAMESGNSENKILFDNFEIKKIIETDIYEVYL